MKLALTLSLLLYSFTLFANEQDINEQDMDSETINPHAQLIVYRHSTTSTAKDIIWPSNIHIGKINIITKNLKSSEKMPAHYHQNFTVIATVLQGDIAIQYGEHYHKKLIVTEGDTFSLPSNLCHINGNASNIAPATVRVAYLIEKSKQMATVSCPQGSKVGKTIENQ